VLYVRKGTAWAAEAKAGCRTTGGSCSTGAAASIIAGGLASCGNVACALAADYVVVSRVQTLPGEDLADFCAARSVREWWQKQSGCSLCCGKVLLLCRGVEAKSLMRKCSAREVHSGTLPCCWVERSLLICNIPDLAHCSPGGSVEAKCKSFNSGSGIWTIMWARANAPFL
jgi:hypothetical protein